MSVTKVTGMMQTSTKGGDIPSASPTVIDTDGDYFDVTGTTNFAAFTVVAGRRFTIQFDGVLTMTHHATNLDLPGGANITTAAGDVAEFFATGTNTVQCVNYTKADGTAIVAGASGDKRNFIIDGDMQNWPDGTAAKSANVRYSSALMFPAESTDGTSTSEQSTDVPTIAQSGHQSKYSVLLKCTGTDGTIGASQYYTLMHYITGSNFGDLYQQTVTLSFWAKTSAANSGHTYYLVLHNGAVNRTYCKSFAPTSSWVKYSFTVAMDTSGTGWDNIGLDTSYAMRISIVLSAGTDTDDGTDGAWAAGYELWESGTAISNFMDDTSNEFYFSQFQLKLGSSTGNFVSLSQPMVQNQVDWYVQRYNYEDASNEAIIGTGNCNATNSMPTIFNYRNKMRIAPTVTKSAVDTFDGKDQASTVVLNTWTANSIGKNAFHAVAGQAGTSWTIGSGGHVLRDGTDTTFVMLDARH